MSQTLRPYQQEALDALRAHMLEGRQRLLLVAATGAGKTTIAAAMIGSAVARGRKVLFLAHRKELIDQCSARLDGEGIDHGVIMAGHPRALPWLPVQVASVQTLARRTPPAADLVIVDEAHHARARSYLRILEQCPGATVIGLTATPWRTDGRGLGGELFEAVVVAATPAQLIEEGYLCRYTGFAYDVPDLSGVRKARTGDYEQHGLELAMGKAKLMGNIVGQYLEHARGKRAVVFAVNVAHSQDIVRRFTEAGVTAEHVDGEMEKAQREAVLARFAAGETLVVSNCNILTEGWDQPEAEVCILARPTLSLALYLQMVGRVLRPAPWAGKTAARIHDHAGNAFRHGPPDADRDYGLDADAPRGSRKKAPGAVQIRACLKCFAMFAPTEDGACPHCGHVAEAHRPPIQEVDDPDVKAVPIHEIRPPDIGPNARRLHFQTLLQDALRTGRNLKWAGVRFKATHGFWPPKAWWPSTQEAA